VSRGINNLDWKDKISNTSQMGGIETSILDNGLGRGTRIAWINTGTGLRYKVVIDRAMDISDAFYNQYSLAWISHNGILPPERFADKGINWLRNFGGGLLTTCGLSHIGGPEIDENGERGLHGLISNIPAEIISIIQPDPLAGKMEMSITGIIKQAQIFGPVLELKRTISGKLGEAKIVIHDEVINRGNTVSPHMLLYHFNLGWPLVDEGSKIFWNGKWQPREEDTTILFTDENDFRTCKPPLENHSGGREEAAYIDIDADDSGMSECGIYSPRINLELSLRFQKKQLPWLTNWQHFGKGEYVLGLEPGTNPPIGQLKAKEQDELILLEPGETRSYTCEVALLEK
tara:strand:- start:63126 stop:64160 length:1035 start_codon:yes stop_codon:yes gene_type:complete